MTNSGAVFLAISAVALNSGISEGAFVAPRGVASKSAPRFCSFRPPVPARRRPGSIVLSDSSDPHSPLEDRPWDKESSYFDQLQEAAKDPAKFEAFVMSTKHHGHDSSAPEAPQSPAKQEPAKTKGKYQRVEDWDAEQKEKKDGSGMTWEEKVQFDGMRGGNQVRQNDILMHHLNSF